MTSELALYVARLKHLLERLSSSIEGLDTPQLNWRPSAPDANSVYVIATHIMGNLEAWVLGIACRQDVTRDRPTEFAAKGPDAAPLIARANELGRRFEEALSGLSEDAPGQIREPAQSHWGIDPTHPVAVREALMRTIDHAATHLGQIDITKDLAREAAR